MAQGNPRRHHYVPRFYLENFARSKKGGEPSFWVYDRAGKEPREQTPVNTAVKRDFYAFVGPSGTRDAPLESQLFPGFEGWAKPVFEKWIRCPQRGFSRSELEMAILYISLQHLRVPRMIKVLQEFQEKFALEWWKWLGRQPEEVDHIWTTMVEPLEDKLWKDKDELREQMQNFDKYFTLEGNPKYALATSLTLFEAISKELLKLVPKLLLAPGTGAQFITSDSPVNVYVPSESNTALFGVGFGLEEVQVVFPISPLVALHLSRQGEPGVFKADGKTVLEFNRRCVMAADRFIISSFQSQRIARHIREFSEMYSREFIDSAAVLKSVENAFGHTYGELSDAP